MFVWFGDVVVLIDMGFVLELFFVCLCLFGVVYVDLFVLIYFDLDYVGGMVVVCGWVGVVFYGFIVEEMEC